MKPYIIEKGHFSEAGNFIAFSTIGERIHIYKRQINKLFPDRQVKFPFYCLAENKTFNSTYGTTFNRLTAEEIGLEKYEIVFYSTLRDRSLEEIIDFKANNLQQEHDELKAAHDKLQKEYDALVAKVERYDGSATRENEKLRDEIKSLQWNYEYAQSERERLELLCKEHENTIMNLQSDEMIAKHVIHKIDKLTQDYINKLIV
jgi:Skp family chaperone for outer membrane proteins